MPERTRKHNAIMALAQRRCVLVARVQSTPATGDQQVRGPDARWTIGRLQSPQLAVRELPFISHAFGGDVDAGSDMLYDRP